MTGHGRRQNSERARAFDTLIRERIPDGAYALFWCAGEGSVMPNSEEEASGYLVVPSSAVWFWWTGWDEARQRVGFIVWDLVEPTPDWGGEYADALRELDEAQADG